MLSPLMILSLDQGKLTPAPRSVGQFDAHLLEDIVDCIAESAFRPQLVHRPPDWSPSFGKAYGSGRRSL